MNNIDITKIRRENSASIFDILKPYELEKFDPVKDLEKEKEALIRSQESSARNFYLKKISEVDTSNSYYEIYTLPIIEKLSTGKKIMTKIAFTLMAVDGENFQQEYFAKLQLGRKFEKIENIRNGIDFINRIEEIIGNGCELTNPAKLKIMENFEIMLKEIRAKDLKRLREDVENHNSSKNSVSPKQKIQTG